MNRSGKTNVKRLTLTGLFAALATVATLIIQIPTPSKGYINLGDCIVNVAAWLLGPVYGAAAAGIGSGLADLISGYAIYAPATFIIKALMAVASYYVFTLLFRKIHSFPARMAAAITAEIIMCAGYVIFETIIYGSFAAAAVGIPANAVQGIAGVASSVMIYEFVITRAVKLAK